MCHVLVIEDEPLVALDLESVLSAAGATSFAFATTEDEAVCAAHERVPDFITSDVTLLEGTGPRAVERIHRELGDVPVLFLTATPADCKLCAPPGSIMPKPFDGRQLAERFRELAPV